MSLTSRAAAWVLSWLCMCRLGRSAVPSSSPTSATIQERCFRLQSSLGSLRYARKRKTQPHLSKEPPLPSDDRRHPFHGLRKTLRSRTARKNCAPNEKGRGFVYHLEDARYHSSAPKRHTP